jgi:hypothetical protein
MAARVVLRMKPSLAKSSPAEETVWRLLSGRITESKVCFARTPAPPIAQIRAAQSPCTWSSSLRMPCPQSRVSCGAVRSKSQNAGGDLQPGWGTRLASCPTSAEHGPMDLPGGTNGRNRGTNQLNAFRSQAVGVARRDPILGRYPLGLEQGELGEAHENRIERARFQSSLAA